MEIAVLVLLYGALFFQAMHLFLLIGAPLKEVALPAAVSEVLPVSVVICARNEAAQLARRLPLILAQDYKKEGVPAFEVLVADDASTDETAETVRALQSRFPQLRYLYIDTDQKSFPGKKGALALAVAAAKYQVLLLTDADCAPASPHWISEMVAALTAGKELVAGYAPYEESAGSLNLFIRTEALFSFLNMAALHRWGIHYMATGRNLLVRRPTFEGAAAHPLWTKTLSGDDDMLVRLAATNSNFNLQAAPEAAMHSPAKKTLQPYIAQKQRHMSTGKYYRPGVKILFFLLNGSQFLFWAVLPFAIILALIGCVSGALLAALGLSLLRIFVFALVLHRASGKLHTRIPVFFLPLFDAATTLHSLFFAPYIFWKNKTTWK